MCWFADHWDDVLSDWSAIHRTEPHELEGMTAREFWPRTVRLLHYQGAVRDVAAFEFRKAQPQSTAPAAAAGEAPPATSTELIDPTPEQIRALRNAARRKRYPADKFGDVQFVTEDQIVREASRA